MRFQGWQPQVLILLLVPPQQECEKEVESHEEEVRLFGDIYDRIVDEDGVCWLLGLKSFFYMLYTVSWQCAI